MATKKKTRSGIEYELGGNNIFADLGLEAPDELQARGMLGIQIFKILESRNVKKQKDVSELLGISKTETSQLMNGNFSRFSEGRLMSFLNRLNYKVTMQISPMQNGDIPQDVVLM